MNTYNALKRIVTDWGMVTGYVPRFESDEVAEYTAARALHDRMNGDHDRIMASLNEKYAEMIGAGMTPKRLSAVAPQVLAGNVAPKSATERRRAYFGDMKREVEERKRKEEAQRQARAMYEEIHGVSAVVGD